LKYVQRREELSVNELIELIPASPQLFVVDIASLSDKYLIYVLMICA